MERIVLGYEGSPAAESALDWITDRLVRRSGLVDVIVIANMFFYLLMQDEARLDAMPAPVPPTPGTRIERQRRPARTPARVRRPRPVRAT